MWRPLTVRAGIGGVIYPGCEIIWFLPRTLEKAMAAKNIGGRPERGPSLKDRRVVTRLAGLGISQDQIAATLGCARKTLAKHYHEELRDGAAKVEAELVQNLVGSAGRFGRDGPAGLTSFFCGRASIGSDTCRRGRPSRSGRRNKPSAGRRGRAGGGRTEWAGPAPTMTRSGRWCSPLRPLGGCRRTVSRTRTTLQRMVAAQFGQERA